jgi:chaperonin GroES
MRGFNQGAVIPTRNLADMKPLPFMLVVRLHPEKEISEYILAPESVRRVKDSTRGWFGSIVAVGDGVKRMKDLIGVIKAGTVCIFDESVSVDDPSRCFDWENERYVMFDISTVLGVQDKNGLISMLGDYVLVRRVKKADYRMTTSKLWVPEPSKPQDLGGVVAVIGPGLPGSKGRLPMCVSVGDFVCFPKFGGTDIRVNGVDHIVFRQNKLLCIIKGEMDRIKFT